MARLARPLGLVVAATIALALASATTARGAGLDLVPPSLLSPSAYLSARAAGYWGGDYTVASGEKVTVFASEAYEEKPEENQRWADFLASLVHGKELSMLTLYRLSPGEIRSRCGFGALACYSPRQHSIVAPVEQPAPDVSVEAALIHEYGHHVAQERSNAPWHAIDRGTKRWASHENICARARRGEVFPSAQIGDRYELNPGEGFAEAYRVLNERRLGRRETSWEAVSRTFYPDEAALRLLDQDVVHPWAGGTTFVYSGRLRRNADRTYSVSTPLDGKLTIALSAPARFSLEALGRARRLARAFARAGGARGSTTICGTRSLRVRVAAHAAAGAYSLRVTTP